MATDTPATTGLPVPPLAPPVAETVALCVADAADTLGGSKEEKGPDHPSVLGHLIRQLRPGQDLTRVLIPSFFLEPRSLLEKMADVMMHPNFAIAIPKLPDPLTRMKGLVRWFTSGFHYRTLGVKKPFNPIIGETFACAWPHEDGSHSQYFAEQVSHRPPVTAIYFENRKNGIACNAQVWTKSKFTPPQTAKSILVGGATVHLTDLDEEYYCTFPTYYCHNLLMGTLRMEVGDHSDIVCAKTGMSCHIDFQQKPYFGGADKVNSLVGTVKHGDAEVATLSGHWDSEIFWTPKGGKKEVLFSAKTEPVAPKMVLPVDRQGPWESRRLWQRAADLLKVRPDVDWSAVDDAKGVLEEDQRTLPCHKTGDAKGPWHTKQFHERPRVNPLTGETENMYTFDHASFAKHTEGEPEKNLLWLSQTLPDVRSPDIKVPTAGAAAAAETTGAGAGAGAGAGGAVAASDAAVAEVTEGVAAAAVSSD